MNEALRHELREWLKALLTALVLAGILRTVLIQPYRVEGSSMEGSLHDSERLFINRLVYRLHPPLRGNIVVLELEDEGITIIKRVIGLPGETIEIRDGVVLIEDSPLTEPYMLEAPLADYGPVQIPDSAYFVMGDNRNKSRDSRSATVGFIDEGQIRGRAFFVYWPVQAMRVLK